MRYAPNFAIPPRPYRPGGAEPRPDLAASGASRPLERSDYRDHAGLAAGFDLFNRGFYWEAHEIWEAAWSCSGGGEKELLSALIQLAAAELKAAMGRLAGADRLRERARGHLELARRCGPIFCGVDLETIEAEARAGALVWRLRSRDLPATPTDIAVQPQDCQISLCADGIRQTTPSRADYFSGNAIFADDPIDIGTSASIEAWRRRCELELPDTARYHSVTSEQAEAVTAVSAVRPIESSDPDVAIDVLTVLRASRLSFSPGAPIAPQRIVIRPLESESDWDAAAALSIEVNEPAYGFAVRPFTRWRYRAFRETVALFGGAFFGAFEGDQIAACLGAVAVGKDFRYQDVQTRVAYRRRGIARALCAHAFTHMAAQGSRRGVIVAEAGGIAETLYRDLGFERVTSQTTVRFKVSDK